jgi:hypothetical protein
MTMFPCFSVSDPRVAQLEGPGRQVAQLYPRVLGSLDFPRTTRRRYTKPPPIVGPGLQQIVLS